MKKIEDTGFTHDSHPAPERSEPLSNSVSGGQCFDYARTDRNIRRWDERWDYAPPAEKVAAAKAAGGRTRAALSTDPVLRKEVPIASCVLDYFPDAIAAVAAVSREGQKQHGTTGWDRSKSGDESDALMRHFMERGTRDTDGLRHSAKVAWRALALLQKEIEADRG